MKNFGSITELVQTVFRLAGNAITLRPNQGTSYTASRDVQLPPEDANAVLVSADSTQTLTNKTIDGSLNTISNVSVSTATGILPAANGGTGQNSSATFPTSGIVVTEAATETLTNKSISGSTNTLTNIPLGSATGILAPANGGTGIANTNTLTTGSNDIALTTSAATAVTLPTTGTLATLAGVETLSNKTLTAPVISTISNTGTLTLPTSTDTLVGRATTDTLTNKSLTAPIQTSWEDFTEIATPGSNPPSGTLRIYSKSGDALYTLNSSGVETAVAAFTAGQIPGTTTNDDATPGNVGEEMVDSQPSAGGPTIPNTTPTNIFTSPMVLTAGDWDISADFGLTLGGGAAVPEWVAGISTTSNGFTFGFNSVLVPNGADKVTWGVPPNTGQNDGFAHILPYRVSIAFGNTVTVYGVVQAVLTGSVVGYGYMRARRIR